MRQIRLNVFETNSSSSHSLIICTEKEYEEWLANKRLLDNYEDKLVLATNVDPVAKEEDPYRYATKEEWEEWNEGKSFSVVSYTSEHGDMIIGFGCGGYE